MILRIDHIAIAVRDYDRAITFVRKIFGVIEGTYADVEPMKYFWQNLSIGDLSRLELLSPTGRGSFLDGFLKNKEGGVHHITLQTQDIKHAKRTLEDNGVPYFGYNEYPGGVWKELFIHPKDAFGVLIQIAEFTADDWLAGSVRFTGGRRWEVEKHGGGVRLTMAHPGGGKAAFNLSGEEAKKLLRDIEKAL
jgi:methylmalonyl-CoA/ethylmalonyl-CoA epimerase